MSEVLWRIRTHRVTGYYRNRAITGLLKGVGMLSGDKM
jgi:hypothetical protein